MLQRKQLRTQPPCPIAWVQDFKLSRKHYPRGFQDTRCVPMHGLGCVPQPTTSPTVKDTLTFASTNTNSTFDCGVASRSSSNRLAAADCGSLPTASRTPPL